MTAAPFTSSNARAYRWGLWALAVVLTAYRVWVIGHLGIDTYVDEAYYWGWSQALDWGYYSKPPVIAGLMAVSIHVLGDNLLALKAPSLLLYPATALVIQHLGQRMFDARTGFWAGLAFLTLPLVSALGIFISTDAPLLFCWALGMLGLWHALHQPKGGLRIWLGIGVALGLGLMSKYTMAAFAGSALLALLAHPGGWRWLRTPGPWVAVLLGLTLLAPNLWWNAQHGFPTFQHTAEITRLAGEGGERGWHPAELLQFLGAQWVSMGALLGTLLVWALAHVLTLVRDTRFRYLLAFALPLLGLVGVQALTGRANGNWAAPIFVAACLMTMAYVLQAHAGRWRWAALAVAVNALSMGVLYHWPAVLQLADKPLTAKNDPFKRARGWSELVKGVAPYRQRHPDAVLMVDDRELMAQMVYGLRPAHYARWQPNPHIEDHYGLTVPYSSQTVGDVLLVLSDKTPAEAVVSHFEHAEQLGVVRSEVQSGLERRATVWLLRGFRGY